MIRFDRQMIGRDLTERLGLEPEYKIFRFAYRDGWQRAGAMFIVRFTLRSMNARANKIFSLLPMLVLLRFRGFMAKYWLSDDSCNRCMGVYYWRTRADAERYSRGIAMGFMSKRSQPGSVSFEILDLNHSLN